MALFGRQKSFTFRSTQVNTLTARGSMASNIISHYRILKKIGAGGMGEIDHYISCSSSRSVPAVPWGLGVLRKDERALQSNGFLEGEQRWLTRIED